MDAPRIRQAGEAGVSESAAATPFGRWADRHALAIDVIVATAVFLYDLMYLVGLYAGFGELSLAAFLVVTALSAMMCVSYVLRRRSPRVATFVVFAAAWSSVVLDVGLSPGPLILLGLMLYFVGARFDRKVVVVAAVVVGVWVVVAAQPQLEKEYLRIGQLGVLVLTALFVATVGIFAQARRRHVEKLRELNVQLARERDVQAVIAAAEERSRIAREIHDIVSHSLGTMVVMADGAAQTATVDPRRAGLAMARVRDTGREAMSEMRRMLNVLRDDEAAQRAPQPGLGQLGRLVDQARATGLRVDLSVRGLPVVLPAGVDLAAYRIVQEALTNARKHGGPMLSVVSVTVAYEDVAIALRIVDDGTDAGAGAGASPAITGHGLVGMQERVKAYGGSLEAGPRPGGGFEVYAVLPIGSRP